MDTWATLTAWIDAIPQALGVPLERTVVGGFSQGGVMAYALALAAGRPTSPPASWRSAASSPPWTA